MRRIPAPDDGRGVVLCLTDAGFALVGQLARIHVESVRRHLIDPLTAEQFRALGEAMQTLRRANAAVGAEETAAP